MRAQLGSHWRWRLLLLLVLVLTIAGARWQAPHFSVMVVPGGGPRIVTASQGRQQVFLMALHTELDKKLDKGIDQPHGQPTGRFRSFLQLDAKRNATYFRAVHQGAAVAWRQAYDLHLAEIDAPHRTRSWPIPHDIGVATIEGLLPDERFAVFQKTEHATGGTSRYFISVVDLSNSQIISTEEWATRIEPSDKPNEFRGTRTENFLDGSESIATCWKLTPAGEWEPLASTPLPLLSQYQNLKLAESPQGDFRILAEGEKPSPSETEIIGVVVAASPSGYMLIDPLVGRRGRILVGHSNASELRATTTNIGYYYGISFPREDAAAVVNLSNDIELLDLTTGKTITTFSFGTHRKWTLGAFALVMAGLAAMWTWLGAREKTSWWLFDASVAMAIVPLVSLIWLVANIHAWQMAGSMASLVAYRGFMIGSVAGTSIMVGWYWTFGHGRTTVRWMIGGLLLCAVCASQSEQLLSDLLGEDHSSTEGMAILWAVCQSASIVVAGFVAILLLATKSFGWAVSDVPLEAPTNRFTLTSLFVATIGVSMLIAVANAVSNEFHVIGLLWFLMPTLGAVLVGNLIASLILSRSIVAAAIHAILIVMLLLATWSVARASFGPMSWLPGSGWIFGACLASSILPIIIASFLARCHGWRWMRASRAIEPPPEMEAARESIESAPQSADVGNQPVLN